MRRGGSRFNWVNAVIVIGIAAGLIALTFAVVPYYAASWRKTEDDRTRTDFWNKTVTAAGPNVTYDPDTGLPTAIAYTGQNYGIDDDFDREFVVDAFSKYRVGTFADQVTPDPNADAQFAIHSVMLEGNDTDGNDTDGVVFDVTITQSGQESIAWTAGLAVVGAVVLGGLAIFFSGGLATVAVGVAAGGLLGGAAGYFFSEPFYQETFEMQTGSEGWATVTWPAGALGNGYEAKVSLSSKSVGTYLDFASTPIVMKGKAKFGTTITEGRTVFTAQMVNGNSDTFIYEHMKTYRSEVVNPKIRMASTWPGDFTDDGTVACVDTSADSTYNSLASEHAGAVWYEVESKRKLTMPNPLPAGFSWVMNVTYGAGVPMVALAKGDIDQSSGTTYIAHWSWTIGAVSPLPIVIYAQFRYSTDGFVTESNVWMGNETFDLPSAIYDVRWRYTYNNPTGEDVHRLVRDRELMSHAVYDMQCGYYPDASNIATVTSKEFISELNGTVGDPADAVWWFATYGRYPWETDGASLISLYDNSTTYHSATGTYDLEGNELLKTTWDIPVDNITAETSYGLGLIQAPFDYRLITPSEIVAESLYFKLTNWLDYRAEMVDIKTLLADYFPADPTEYIAGSVLPLRELLDKMSGKLDLLEASTLFLEGKYGSNDDSKMVHTEVARFADLYAQIDKILREMGSAELNTNPESYNSVVGMAYTMLDAYCDAFTQYSGYIMELKGEKQIHGELNTVLEYWRSTITERYTFYMKDINEGNLKALALAMSMIVVLSIVAATHYAYVRKTAFWNKSTRHKAGIIAVYVIFAVIGIWALYTFVFIGIMEYWYGVALGA